MIDAASAVRQRKLAKSKTPTGDDRPATPAVSSDEADSSADSDDSTPSRSARHTRSRIEHEDADNIAAYCLDVLRVVVLILLASAGLSYLVSGGQSLTWSKHKPKVMDINWWKAKFYGPLALTPAELAFHDGSHSTKPLYLAVNGSIFDVSSNPAVYGPGGSYHSLIGVDASRAFVTGCFATDRTADLRGVEAMFLPLDDPEIDARYAPTELAAMRERELTEARRRVEDSLAHWVRFFAKSPKYHEVGRVVREPGWLEREPVRELCEAAQKARRTRDAWEKGKGK